MPGIQTLFCQHTRTRLLDNRRHLRIAACRIVTKCCVARIPSREFHAWPASAKMAIGDRASAQAEFCGIAVPCQHNPETTEFEFRHVPRTSKPQHSYLSRKKKGMSNDTHGKHTSATKSCSMNALCIMHCQNRVWSLSRRRILIGGSSLHHCQTVIKLLVNSAMGARKSANTAFGGVASIVA